MSESAAYLAEHMADVPVLVIPCVLDRPPGGAEGEARLASGEASSLPSGASSSPSAAGGWVRPGPRST